MQLKSSALKSPQKRPKKVQKQRWSKFELTEENSPPSEKIPKNSSPDEFSTEDSSESEELQLQTKNLDGNFSVSSVSSEDKNVVDKIVRVTLRGYKCSKCEFKTTLVDAIETHEKEKQCWIWYYV